MVWEVDDESETLVFSSSTEKERKQLDDKQAEYERLNALGQHVMWQGKLVPVHIERMWENFIVVHLPNKRYDQEVHIPVMKMSPPEGEELVDERGYAFSHWAFVRFLGSDDCAPWFPIKALEKFLESQPVEMVMSLVNK